MKKNKKKVRSLDNNPEKFEEMLKKCQDEARERQAIYNEENPPSPYETEMYSLVGGEIKNTMYQADFVIDEETSIKILNNSSEGIEILRECERYYNGKSLPNIAFYPYQGSICILIDGHGDTELRQFSKEFQIALLNWVKENPKEIKRLRQEAIDNAGDMDRLADFI